MKYIRLLIVFIVVVAGDAKEARGQGKFKYNFNSENGLPSNHVYNIIEDKFGYLWFTTPKGIVKYSGYDFRFFGLPDGLSTEDNWELFEDKKGRIWLGSNSEEIGYLYHNSYHKAILENISTEIFPQHMHSFNNGIMFCSPFINKTTSYQICIEENDTIRKLNFAENLIPSAGSTIPAYMRHYPLPYISERNQFGLIDNKFVYACTIQKNKIILQKKISIRDTTFFKKVYSYPYITICDITLFYQYTPKIAMFYVVNLTNGITSTVNIENFVGKEKIEHVYLEKTLKKQNYFYIITKNKILKFDPDSPLHPKQIFNIDSFRQSPEMYGSDIKVFFQSTFWGSIIGSNTTGADALLHFENHFKKEKQLKLPDFKYVGAIADVSAFWWNNSNSTLAQIDSNLNVKFSTHKNIGAIASILPYAKDTFYAVGPDLHSTQWFLTKLNRFIPSNIDTISKTIHKIFRRGKDQLVILDTRYYYDLKFTPNGTRRNQTDAGKYFDMVYDSLSESYLAYNAFKISVHGIHDSIFSRSQIHKLELERIDRIIVDNKYGNIFIKGSTGNEFKLISCNLKTFFHVELFHNYNMKGAEVSIYNNTLIVAGRFGVLFCKILGLNKLSNPIVYENIKNINYKNIYDVQVSWNKLLLNTDKGFYTVTIPSDSADYCQKPARHDFKIILQNNNNIHPISANDTIIVDQHDNRIQFDIINAAGNGKLQFFYKLAPSHDWNQLNSNELTLPREMRPGVYYKMLLKFNDDIWKSNATELTIYITPYWWQTLFQNVLFWIVVSIIFISIIISIVVITKRSVNAKNEKKTLQQEMELKSVYSQINPHFIFNTLNTALYFIKKRKVDEAYDHVSKFSKLLRAYIKSSRSKYISIGDEVNNLNNYIQLQQTRFEDKFTYEIIVDDDIDISRTKIPALLLQPIVENAIDHGLFHKNTVGHLKIEFKKIPLSNEIQCVVDDNGIGRKEGKILSAGSLVKAESYGDSLIKDLVTIFNKYENSGINIQYFDKEAPETGTTVLIAIKNPYHEK